MKWWGLVATMVVAMAVCSHQFLPDLSEYPGGWDDFYETTPIPNRNANSTPLLYWLYPPVFGNVTTAAPKNVTTLAPAPRNVTTTTAAPRNVTTSTAAPRNATTRVKTAGPFKPYKEPTPRKCYQWNCQEGNCVNVTVDKLKDCPVGYKCAVIPQAFWGRVERFCTNRPVNKAPFRDGYEQICDYDGCNAKWMSTGAHWDQDSHYRRHSSAGGPEVSIFATLGVFLAAIA